MTIYIDADACPVVDITLLIAKEFAIPCVILCDTAHHIQRQGAQTLTVSKGADSVDFKLVNMIRKGDLAITQDYGLAAMCLAKGALALHQNGIRYTDENIDGLLHSRYAAKKVRAAGGRMKGPRPRTKAEDLAFSKALRELLENPL